MYGTMDWNQIVVNGIDLSEEGHRQLGNFYFTLGEYEKALDEYKVNIENSPQKISNLQDYGNVLSILGRHEEAIKVYQKLIDVDSTTWIGLVRVIF